MPRKAASKASPIIPSPSCKADGYASVQLVYIFGTHAVRAALHNPRRLPVHLWHDRPLPEDIAQITIRRKVPFTEMERPVLQKMIGADCLYQGMVLGCQPLEEIQLEDFLPQWKNQSHATLVVLDQINDPRNMGAILRSALCLGADAVLCTHRHSPPENGHMAKAASGALEAMPCIRVNNMAQSLKLLKKNGFWCYGFSRGGKVSLHKADLPSHAVLIFGTEGKGIRRLSSDLCDEMLAIPHNPMGDIYAVDSLNLGQSVAISLYARQVAFLLD